MKQRSLHTLLGVTVALLPESTASLVVPLGRDIAKIVALNLRNRMTFKATNQDYADESAGRLGKKKQEKVSWSSGRDGRRRNSSKEDDYVVSPNTFRRLRSHECLLIQCRGKYRRVILPPLLPNGKAAPWFRGSWYW